MLSYRILNEQEKTLAERKAKIEKIKVELDELEKKKQEEGQN